MQASINVWAHPAGAHVAAAAAVVLVAAAAADALETTVLNFRAATLREETLMRKTREMKPLSIPADGEPLGPG